MAWQNATKSFTLEQALEAHKIGICLEVNDGKDITVRIEKEPTPTKEIGS